MKKSVLLALLLAIVSTQTAQAKWGGLKDLLGHFDRAFDRTDKVIGGAALAGALLNDRETKEDRLDRENKELKEQLNREWERDTIEICRQCSRPDSDNDR